MTRRKKRALVVGGGIAGLACAYDLAKDPGWEVTLAEGSRRLGGKILSEEAEGLVLEGGPDSFLTAKPEALALARELGLAERLLPTNAVDKDVFVYTRGALRRFPEGLMLLAPSRLRSFLASDLLPWTAKLRMALEPLVPRGDLSQDESIAAFTRRRFGKEAVEVLAGPVMAGIYAGDPERLSLESTFPQFREMERHQGSVLKAILEKRVSGARPRQEPGVSMFMTLRGGLEGLVRALAERLPEGAVRFGARLKALRYTETGFRAEFESGRPAEVEQVVLAVGADAAARALAPIEGRLVDALSEFRFASTAVVSLAYPSEGAAGALKGFGFVADRREGLSISAATYGSSKFPGRYPGGRAVVRCFLGGIGREAALEGDDEELIARARDDLRRVAGLDAEPVVARVYRWPRSNPQYEVGHGGRIARLASILRNHPGLVLAGSSYKGVGIPDCIRSGREAARRLLAGDLAEGFVA